MGVYDQGARFATEADPKPVFRKLLTPTKVSLTFRDWQNTRTIPLPGGPDRTADLVAALDDPTGQPLLAILEFQSQHDPEKLDVTLVEAAVLRCHARPGIDPSARYKVLTALIYLKGRCPEPVLDMTLPGGFGTRHAPLIWNVEDDNAITALEEVASGVASWGTLFWVPLMAEGGQEGVIARWKELVEQVVPDTRTRGNLAGIALVFAELVGRGAEWKRQLEGFKMTESAIVNEWINMGEAKGKLEERRQTLLELLEGRFPGLMPQDVVQLIQQQESVDLLQDWFKAAVRAFSFEQFMDVLKR